MWSSIPSLKGKAPEGQTIACQAKQLEPVFKCKEEPMKDIKTRSNYIRGHVGGSVG